MRLTACALVLAIITLAQRGVSGQDRFPRPCFPFPECMAYHIDSQGPHLKVKHINKPGICPHFFPDDPIAPVKRSRPRRSRTWVGEGAKCRTDKDCNGCLKCCPNDYPPKVCSEPLPVSVCYQRP